MTLPLDDETALEDLRRLHHTIVESLPSEKACTIDTIDAFLARLTETDLVGDPDARGMKATVTRFRNGLTTIARLPIEIRFILLRYAQCPLRHERYAIIRRTALLFVCRLFKDTVEADPHMWSSIEAGPSPARNLVTIPRALILSREVPLDIRLSSSRLIGGYKDRDMIGRLLLSHGHRWNRVILDGDLLHDAPRENWKLPQLTELSIQSPAWVPVRPLPQAPRLRHLRMTSTAWYPGSQVEFPSLESLDLCGVFTAMNADSFAEMLWASPNLVSLSLNVDRGPAKPQEYTAPRDHRSVSFMFLRDIFMDNDPTYTIGILSRIHAPNLEILDLSASTSDPQTLISVLECILSRDPAGVLTVMGRIVTTVSVEWGIHTRVCGIVQDEEADQQATCLKLALGDRTEALCTIAASYIAGGIPCGVGVVVRSPRDLGLLRSAEAGIRMVYIYHASPGLLDQVLRETTAEVKVICATENADGLRDVADARGRSIEVTGGDTKMWWD